MKKIILAMLVILIVLTGCGQQQNNIANNYNNGNKIRKNVNINDRTGNTSVSNVKPIATDTKTSVGKAPYTGEDIDENNINNVPFLAVIENIKAARPQSGLSEADIVFETLAEGGIPRCMALFQSHKIINIGPIRSDRLYFNEIADAMNLPFAHCGGSQKAIDDADKRHLMTLNEMRNGKYYWRIKTRKAPHNLYTSTDKISELIKNRGYNKKPEFNLEFDNQYWKSNDRKATQVNIKMSGYYTTSYIFNGDKYTKLMNGKSIKDKNTGGALTARNIIIQFTKIAPIAGDKKLRVEIDLTGSGSGYAISNGTYKRIKWSKDGGTSPINITDESGKPIKLSTGNTWWEIVDIGTKVKFNQK